jgi:hypothetical protein
LRQISCGCGAEQPGVINRTLYLAGDDLPKSDICRNAEEPGHQHRAQYRQPDDYTLTTPLWAA